MWALIGSIYIATHACWKCEAIIATLATPNEDARLCPTSTYANQRRRRGVPYDRRDCPESVDTLPDPVWREVIVIQSDMRI
jgi:hypothetical protein